MKKTKKFLKIVFVTAMIIFSLAVFSGAIFFEATTYGLKLDTEKLESTKNVNSPKIVSQDGSIINESNSSYIPITKLSSNTKNAFICTEDKRFYSHGGVDYIRMAGATISNIKSHSFSEGASTISQQLIKNTQLSSEKTISRKLKEIKLSKELEKKYSKNEILEMYLNNIYFGNGCYGIENASKHYFGKSASALTLDESALLAGTINAPSVYDIENRQEKAKTRRNLVLALMQKYGKINEEEKQDAEKKDIKLNLTTLSNNNYVFSETIREACKILNKSETQLKNGGYKIYTYFDPNLSSKISKTIKQKYSSLESNPTIATIVIDNKTNGIVSVTGSSKSFLSKKQPGSLIKPILVYSEAFEENKISPATLILDEKINISGYAPENADKKFHGYVSVRECLKNSYNIPAVKILNETGISNSKKLAEKLGIEFSENDNNLALALGGFSEGVTLQSLADAYAAIANDGNYAPSNFISKITQNGKTIYESSPKRTSAMKDSTAFLLTDILKDTSKTGTAKRLKDFDFEIASKTGTVGTSNSSENLEAFCVAYTTDHTILSYIGSSVMPNTINGATYPTMLDKDILNELYKTKKPQNFKKPNSVKEVSISKSEYKKNIITRTDESDDAFQEYFSKENLPQKNEKSLSLLLEAKNLENKKPILSFFASENYSCKLMRKTNNFVETIFESDQLENQKIINFEDKTAKNGQIYEYFVEFCEKSTEKTYESNHIKLKSY